MDDNLAQVLGYENAEDYEWTIREQERITKKSKEFYHTPPEKWPSITFNWDYRVESRRFCFDGLSQSKFETMYPKGLILGHMPLKEFDKYLCRFSHSDSNEPWEDADYSKLAEMIVYLSEGNLITPPIIIPIINKNKIAFEGGHHRYRVAKAVEINDISIYAYPEDVEILNQFMDICWVKE